MEEDTTLTRFHLPGTILDPLTGIVREGARRILAAALWPEAARFVASFTDERLPDGRQRVVHHGAGPARMIQTGIGPVPVLRHKMRDRATDVPAEKRVRFTSTILPRWARRSRSLEALRPVLCLRGVLTEDFQDEAPSGRDRGAIGSSPMGDGSRDGPNRRRCRGRTCRTCRPA